MACSENRFFCFNKIRERLNSHWRLIMSKYLMTAVLAAATGAFGLTASASADVVAKAGCCCGEVCNCEECGCCADCKDGQCTDCSDCGCEGCDCCEK
jgi:hypothetical protein